MFDLDHLYDHADVVWTDGAMPEPADFEYASEGAKPPVPNPEKWKYVRDAIEDIVAKRCHDHSLAGMAPWLRHKDMIYGWAEIADIYCDMYPQSPFTKARRPVT